MAERACEHFEGLGTIFNVDGSELGQRWYRLTVFEDRLDVGQGHTIPGLRRIQGRIALIGKEETTLVADRAELTLRVPDGRTLLFLIRKIDGTITPRGLLI